VLELSVQEKKLAVLMLDIRGVKYDMAGWEIEQRRTVSSQMVVAIAASYLLAYPVKCL
jgi:hypothetical protein